MEGAAVSNVKSLLQQAHDLGPRFCVAGDRVEVEGSSPLPPDLMARLRESKTEIRSYLETEGRKTSSFDLPFPIGYGGLPKAQVEAAEVINNKLGINDPVVRKYNVLSWVRGHYVDLGQNHGEHYGAIKREQQRLGQLLRGQADNS
jgi:hypothetical protein